ncbi:helix-turn-helix transcriptional regulator [Schlegelella sp. S2-27]|uniref:Helix-turn-helix transcriptional regulator n=1 Tax=Caldimonas mangrovi TaxID=2944811 RepID=A0ABT0YN57_9BURK|nr:helix-turn-helix transcriptional regulator [Caldimonas mangrovi]MCM5680168.1 helix-turn-helix transcriptional regulator [Caldimonas mangrovi]
MPADAPLLRLARARALLCDVAVESMPLDAVAREAGLSTSQFIRRFHAVFGETPHQMRIRMRLEAAKRLLVLHGETVTAACMAVGFSSLGSFSHLFAQRYGEPPSAYRRRLLAAPGLPQLLVPDCVSLMNAAFAAGIGPQFSRSVPPAAVAESTAGVATPAARIPQEKLP